MAKKKHIKIPVEALLGVLFVIIIVGLLALFWGKLFNDDLPSEEICDLLDNDMDGEIDEGFAVTCAVDSQCGPNGVFGDLYCKGGDVYQQGYESRCVGSPDTCLSECTNRQVETLIQDCPDGCLRGRCVGSAE